MTKFLLSLLFITSTVFRTHAQRDTSFWFAAPDISTIMGDNPIVFHFQTYDQPSIITITQPALSGTLAINATITVPANSVFTLNVTPYISVVENAPVNTINSNGIYISAKDFISVYYSIGSSANKELISLKGQRALGVDFYASMPTSVLTHTVSDGGVGFDIVATKPGTTIVLITPAASCVGHAKNITFARMLTQGQTFSVMDNNSVNPSQLAGSIISSDKPIAVTVKGSISTTTNCHSYFADQILPTNETGKDYVVRKGDGNTDVAYVLAQQNATGFTVTSSSGSTAWLVNSGETYSINITDPIYYIKLDKQAYLFHLSGYGCKMSGAQLAPVFCAGSYTSAFVRSSSDSLNLNIVTRSGFQSNFTLTSNGIPIPISTTNFSTVPGSSGSLVSGRVYLPTSSVSVGSYNTLVNGSDIFGLSVINGGTNGGSAYSQVSDFEINAYAIANVVPTATICGNTQYTLNGKVGGGPITGIWSIVQGYGSLSGSVTQLTNNIYTPSLLDTTNNAASITPNNRYVKIILNSTGICPNVADTFKLQVKQPPIVNAGSNTFVCTNNSTIQLNGNVYGATNQGVWTVLSPGSGTFVNGVTSFTPIYQLSTSDTTLNQLSFVLTSTNNAGCIAVSDTVEVGISKAPLVKASSIQPIIRCSNNGSVSLNGLISGTVTTTGIWQTNGSGVFLPNNVALSTNYHPSVNDVTFGSVWLFLESTNNGLCFAEKDSVQIIFTSPSYANAGGDLNSCVNDPQAKLNGIVNGTLTTSGTWSGGGGTYLPSNSALNATYLATPSEVSQGFVTLTLTSTNNGNCLATSDDLKINFQQKPLANFSVNAVCFGEASLFRNQSIDLSGSGIIKKWIWDFGDNTYATNVINPIHTYSVTGGMQAQLIVKNIFDCADTISKEVLVYDLPLVNFSVSRACNGSAQEISFKDLSSVVPPSSIPLATGYFWDFGGFGNSMAKDTTIIFPSEGRYSVTHIITTNFGCRASASQSVDVSPRPVAKFLHINNSIPGLGATVEFIDTSLYAVKWDWDFGNGETSNLKNPKTYYAQNGLYVVTETVYDQFNCPSTYTSEIKISTIVSDIVKLIPNVVTPNDDGKNDFWRLDFIDVFFPNAEIEIYNRWGTKIFRSVGYSNAWNGSYLGDPLPVGTYFYTINLHDKDQTPVIKGTISLIK